MVERVRATPTSPHSAPSGIARIEADRQNRYVVTISRPSVPDAATHPDGVRGVLTVTVICFMLLGVGSLLLASVREHANV
ncbi:MAG: hypothetical protein H6726_18625 [Sandaracinaceae bacterium]|nr:hypothetical protein [Sandaracinaceae bacterium]